MPGRCRKLHRYTIIADIIMAALSSKLNQAISLSFVLLTICNATVTVPDTHQQFSSQPASFGMYFQDGREYIARLQSLFESDPYLCDRENIDKNREKIVVPDDGLPVALLAEKGQCTFEEKARIAQDLHSVVKYIIVFNNIPGDNTLVTMSAEDSNGITVGAQFVTYSSGTDLLLAIEEDGDLNDNGDNVGCRIYLDAYISWDDLGWISWVFVLLTCMVSMFLCLSTGYVRSTQSNVRVIIVNGHRQYEELLTQEQVDDLSEMEYSAPGDSSDTEENSSNDDLKIATAQVEEDKLKNRSQKKQDIEKYSSCSICLEEFEIGEKLLSLPCGHYFHSHCIGPWLTERQPTCPLCKANVKADIAQRNNDEISEEDEQAPSSILHTCCYPFYYIFMCCYHLLCCLFCCYTCIEEDQDEEGINSNSSSSINSDTVTMTTPLLDDEHSV